MLDVPLGHWEIIPFTRFSTSERYVNEVGCEDVEWFLSRYRSDFVVMSKLRSLLVSTDPVARLNDDEVIRLIAMRLEDRQLLLRVDDHLDRSSPDAGGGETPDQP